MVTGQGSMGKGDKIGHRSCQKLVLMDSPGELSSSSIISFWFQLGIKWVAIFLHGDSTGSGKYLLCPLDHVFGQLQGFDVFILFHGLEISRIAAHDSVISEAGTPL